MRGLLRPLEGLGIGLLQGGSPSYQPGGLGRGIAAGLMQANQLQRQAQQQHASDALLALRKQSLVDQEANNAIRNRLIRAQTLLAQQKTRNPYLGITGPAAQYQFADHLDQIGNHAEAQKVRAAADAQTYLAHSRGDYYDANLQDKYKTTQQKNLEYEQSGPTPTKGTRYVRGADGKTHLVEESDQSAPVQQGTGAMETQSFANSLPAGEHEVPLDTGRLRTQMALYNLKNITDSATRQRNLFATNIEKSLKLLSPTFTNFAGPQRKLYLGKELAKITTDKNYTPPKDVQGYLNAVRVQIPILVSQIRQFYGDSVQPSVQEKLEKITNPAIWTSNPIVAMSSFNALKKTLNNEIGTYRSALQSPDVYYGKGPGAKVNNQSGGAPSNSFTSPFKDPKASTQNIMDYASRNNMTPQQVVSLLRQKGIS